MPLRNTFLLQEDNISFLLQQDGFSKIIIGQESFVTPGGGKKKARGRRKGPRPFLFRDELLEDDEEVLFVTEDL